VPRKIRLEYSGAVYHVMSRGDRREDIFYDDVDRQDFLKTLAEACQKTGFQVHAYCLMPNHFHAIIETPNANLVAGMRWLLSSYTLRLNHRRKLFGHVFSGRYKALIVESGNGYLRTVCDYVHLNPVRANLIRPEDRLLAYPWSSLGWYLSSPEHRPSWIRTDRLLGEHGIHHDNPAGRAEFERRMEHRRAEHDRESPQWKTIRRGWCLGTEQFRERMLALVDGRLGDHHSGQLKQESAEAKAERIIAEELHRLGWTQSDLPLRLKSDPGKLHIANRLRKETILSIKWIATRLHLGTWKSASARIHSIKKARQPNEQLLL
jgi:putative transposase